MPGSELIFSWLGSTFLVLCLIIFLFLCACFVTLELPGKPCDGIDPAKRKDCGYLGISRDECVMGRHCCWDESVQNAPWCFHAILPPVGKS